MSKGFGVIGLIIFALIAGDRMLGQMSRGRQPSAAEANDVRNLVSTKPASGPTTQMGKDAQGPMLEMRDAQDKWVEEQKAHPLDGILDWSVISTLEGRKKNIANLEANYESTREYVVHVAAVRKKIEAVAAKYGERGSFAEETATDGKLLRERRALYDKYLAVMDKVAKAKLVAKDGEMRFADEAGHDAYKAALEDSRKAERNFTDLWNQHVRNLTEKANQAKARLNAAAGS